MQQTTYTYENEEFNILVRRMPIWFEEFEISGDLQQGSIILHSQNIFDDDWGPVAKIELNWEKMNLEKYYHPRALQKNIDVYGAIKVVLTKKKKDWLNSHIYTLWHGTRRKLIKRTPYVELSIHGIFYCENTQRVIDLNAGVIKEYFQGFEPYIIDAFNSFVCH